MPINRLEVYVYWDTPVNRRSNMRNQPEYNILLVEDDPGHAALINRAFETHAHCRLVITATLAAGEIAD